jgi:hypothetical protein
MKFCMDIKFFCFRSFPSNVEFTQEWSYTSNPSKRVYGMYGHLFSSCNYEHKNTI